MDIVKIIGVGLIALIIIVILKQYKPEFAMYVSLIAGALILFMLLDKLTGIVELLANLSNKAGINNQFLGILLKITGIAFLTEFAVSICQDSGETTIANKIDLGGKVIIIAISIPIISALLELIIKILPWCGGKMKKIFGTIIIALLFLSLFSSQVQAVEESIIEAEKSSLNISGFIEEAQKYTKEIFPDVDLSNILNSAIKGEVNNETLLQGIFNMLGTEIKSTIRTLASILIIVVIHSVFKSISENLGNKGISQITYYVQYILIVTIIMSNFVDIIKMTTSAINNLVNFMYMLTPILITLMITTGSIVSANVIQPVLLFAITFIGNIISNIIMPIMLISTVFSIISNISNKVQIDKLSNFFKSGIVWGLRNNAYNICGTIVARRYTK